MSCAVCLGAVWIAGMAAAAGGGLADMPLGVYWPGEHVLRDTGRQIDWQKNEAVLDSLASNHCNTIWLTHMSAPDAAEMARRAAGRGIRLVASLGELDGGVPNHRAGEQAPRIARILEQWGDAPPPLAWGLADEPRADYMHEMAAYANQWAAAGQPITTVVMAGDVPSAAALIDLDYLCADIYPFFGAGDPNGPDNIAESAAYVKEAGARCLYWARRRGIPYWFMGALFQDPWGPHEADEQGNVVYLPGGGPHFRFPSEAEVRWQNWAALATGARGLIHFTLFMGDVKPNPGAKPLGPDLPFDVKTRTNSGLPRGMLYPNGRPTAPFLAMGRDFGRIAGLAPLLMQLVPCEEPVAFHSKGWIPPGDIVQVMRTEGRPAAEYFAIVVNGDMTQARDVPMNVQSNVVRVLDAATGKAIPLVRRAAVSWEPIGEPFRQARVALEPGAGTLVRLVLATEGPVTVPRVGGVARDDLPFEPQPDGTKRFRYAADLQKDGGTVDAASSGGFTDTRNPGSAHINGAFGETIYLFEMPGAIVSIRAKGVFGNHKDGVSHTFAIAHSSDGKTFKPLAERQFPGGGNAFVVEGTYALEGAPSSVWVAFRPDDANGFITLKQVAVELGVK